MSKQQLALVMQHIMYYIYCLQAALRDALLVVVGDILTLSAGHAIVMGGHTDSASISADLHQGLHQG